MDPEKIAFTENLRGGGGGEYPSFLTRVLERKRNLRRDPLKAQVVRTGTKLSRSQEGCKVLFPFGARPTPVENM